MGWSFAVLASQGSEFGWISKGIFWGKSFAKKKSVSRWGIERSIKSTKPRKTKQEAESCNLGCWRDVTSCTATLVRVVSPKFSLPKTSYSTRSHIMDFSKSTALMNRVYFCIRRCLSEIIFNFSGHFCLQKGRWAWKYRVFGYSENLGSAFTK